MEQFCSYQVKYLGLENWASTHFHEDKLVGPGYWFGLCAFPNLLDMIRIDTTCLVSMLWYFSYLTAHRPLGYVDVPMEVRVDAIIHWSDLVWFFVVQRNDFDAVVVTTLWVVRNLCNDQVFGTEKSKKMFIYYHVDARLFFFFFWLGFIIRRKIIRWSRLLE